MLQIDSSEKMFRQLRLCLGLGVLILIPYLNSFTAGLLFDSVKVIVQNPFLREVTNHNIGQILAHNYWWPALETNLYRPVTTLTYLLNYAILGSGDSPFGYHLINFLLHWANACLVLLIVNRLAARLDVAVLTAAFFAVHPVNTEAVTNVVGRADLLATLAVLFGGWCYLQALDSKAHKAYENLWLTLMGVTAFVGLLAKENAAMIVAFIALIDVFWSRRFRWKPYAALVPAFALVWLVRQRVILDSTAFSQPFLDNPIVGATPIQGFMTAIGVIGRYLVLLVFPRTLSIDYSFNQIPLVGTSGNAAGNAVAVISAIAIATLIGVAVWLRSRQKLISWGILFLFIMMLPTSNLFLKIGSIMSERFLYLPSIGFCAVLAAIFCSSADARPQLKPAFHWILPSIVILLFGIRTFARNGDWHDDLSLWKSTVAASPGSFKAHTFYGTAIYQDAQRTQRQALLPAIDDALREMETARKIVETEPPLPVAWRPLDVELGAYYGFKGDLLQEKGRQGEAVSAYRQALETLMEATALDRQQNDALREAKVHSGVPVDQIPDLGNVTLYTVLGVTYKHVGDWQNSEVAGHYLQHIAPENTDGYAMVGEAAFNLGRPEDAAVQYLAGLLIDPDKRDMWNDLGTIYKSLGIEPNPVSPQGNHMVLDAKNATVQKHVNEAAITVVRLFKEAKRPDLAAELKNRFVRQYAVPEGLFSD
jgi:protein O-mannosyl-transferase